EHPGDAAELRAGEREQRADVAGRRERAERPCQQPVLVQRDDCPERCEREQPPAADVDRAEHDRQRRRRDEEARDGVAHSYLPPNRRLRCAYSASAWRRSRASKSGQSRSTKTSSAYASCQSMKFDTRSSPLVRISRSGSGSSGAYRFAASTFSSISRGSRPLSAIRRVASTSSARPP